jgi:hypothetical protein
MNYQGHDITDGSDDARVSKKREKPDDDASDCSGAFSSEEGDDSDGECDNITTWNCSQRGALPYFLPYTRGHDADTSSPYGDSPCGDSPDSESTTSGTTSDTPASSISGLTGGIAFKETGIPHQAQRQASKIMVTVQFLEPGIDSGQRSPIPSLFPLSAGILPLA